jgi:hypothetical protein
MITPIYVIPPNINEYVLVLLKYNLNVQFNKRYYYDYREGTGNVL